MLTVQLHSSAPVRIAYTAAAWLKVDPIGPNLMLEKTTLELGLFFSRSPGTPEVVGQVPRATPGLLGSAVVG